VSVNGKYISKVQIKLVN